MAKPDVNKLRKKAVNFSMLSDATDTILTGVQKMFDNLRGELTKSFGSVNKRFEKLENKIDFVHTDLHHQITDLKYDTPSLEDFESLKKRVDLFHSVS